MASMILGETAFLIFCFLGGAEFYFSQFLCFFWFGCFFVCLFFDLFALIFFLGEVRRLGI